MQTLPRVDSLGSRQFLQSLLPYLCTVPSPLRPLEGTSYLDPSYRTRALDVGAGIGRVTSNVLLHMFQDVVLLEPIGKFVDEAKRACEEGKWKGIASTSGDGDGAHRSTKSVTFLTGPLQDFDPTQPASKQRIDFHAQRRGCTEPEDEGFDVVWCQVCICSYVEETVIPNSTQWTLGHLSDTDLISFFKRAQASLRKAPTGRAKDDGFIVVKENVSQDARGNKPATEFDARDSSVTRYFYFR